MQYFPIAMIIILSVIWGGNFISSNQKNTIITPTPTAEVTYPAEVTTTPTDIPTQLPTGTPEPTLAVILPSLDPTRAYLINQINSTQTDINNLEKAKNELDLLNKEYPPTKTYPSDSYNIPVAVTYPTYKLLPTLVPFPTWAPRPTIIPFPTYAPYSYPTRTPDYSSLDYISKQKPLPPGGLPDIPGYYQHGIGTDYNSINNGILKDYNWRPWFDSRY